ncbi:MAG TPA: RdgB/HAM1 family non-canonical purine NTP pyrophosphatase [Candidatus Omnitrophota bacterium]|nr:RdgB/HAM1 family non-canonical purine NTP pyrophosphatase [Candidatus Omnitrophota bacterium]
MISLLLASRNRKKTEELQAILRGLPVRVLSLPDFPDAPEVIEDGKTFAENAAKKAVTLADWCGMPALGEDSGLCVEALGGAPGIYSARYAEHGDDLANCRKLLAAMKDVPPDKRQAAFHCAVVIAAPGNKIVGICEGRYPGTIATDFRGTFGFGYDPVFFDPSTGKHFAELEPEFKNRISHRAIALAKAKDILTEYLASQKSVIDK